MPQSWHNKTFDSNNILIESVDARDASPDEYDKQTQGTFVEGRSLDCDNHLWDGPQRKIHWRRHFQKTYTDEQFNRHNNYGEKDQYAG